MNSSNTLGGTVLAVAIIGGAVYLVLNVKSDRAKFDALRVGMSVREVQAIVGPKTGRYGHFNTDIGDNETLSINGIMELTIRGGRLVEKTWTGKKRTAEARDRGREPCSLAARSYRHRARPLRPKIPLRSSIACLAGHRDL